MSTRDVILAAVKGPRGLAITDLGGNSKTIGCAICKLVNKGLVFRAKLGHRTVRYFDTAARAAAYTNRTAPPRPHRGRAKLKEGWGPNDPAHITSATIVTIAPPPPQPTRTNTWSVY